MLANFADSEKLFLEKNLEVHPKSSSQNSEVRSQKQVGSLFASMNCDDSEG